MPHYPTNRGRQLIAQGAWDDDTAALIRLGLFSGASVPTGIDSQVEVNPLNFVSDALAIGSERRSVFLTSRKCRQDCRL